MNVFPQRARETQFRAGSSPTASPDRSSSKSPSRSSPEAAKHRKRSISANLVKKETPAEEPPELDDFGLPIRRYDTLSGGRTAAKKEEENEGAVVKAKAPRSKSNGTEKAGKDAEAVAPVEHASTEAAAAEPSTPNMDQGEHSDSDGEEFKDAEEVPVKGVLTERDAGQEDPLRTPVPATGPEQPIAAAETAEGKTVEALENKTSDKTGPVAEAGSHTATTEGNDSKEQADLEAKTPTTARPSTPTAQVAVADLAQTEAGKDLPQSPTALHSRDSSVNNPVFVSEFSHQQLTAHKENEGPAAESDWQVMPAFAPYKIYDDDNKLVADEAPEVEDEKYGYAGLGGAGKGYTRVQMDDDAESANSMDENTQYLFKDAAGGTSLTEDEEAQRDAVSQLQATKDLLTEGQRVAYVGLTRLVLSAMLKQVENLPHGAKGKNKKDVQQSAESMQMWSQKMMIRLYTHMEISPAEQVMIEQLTDHGVQPKDLTGLLMANARVKNPMADDAKSSSGSEAKSPRPSSSSDGKEIRLSSSDAGSSKDSEKVEELDDEVVADPPPAYEATDGEDLQDVRTPSQLPTTEKIDIDIRWTVLCDLFLVLIADSIYDSRSRVLLERVGTDIEITPLDICRFEKKVTDALEMQQNAEKENWNEDEHMEHRRKMALRKRYMYMGLATVGGGLVIGLSAGLMAPLIGAGLAAGFTTIGVTGTSGFLAGAGGAAIITSGAAASGGIIGVKAANRRTGAVKTFEYRPLHNNKRVNLIVTVSGWMTGKVDDVRLPYSTVDPVMGDIYSVLWEPEMLTSMGDTINILATEALTQGLQQILGSTILVGLMAALQLPVVLTKLSYLIDNPWAVSLDRAQAAGLILADSLIDRNLGTRPITLIGYSLGSRVIFSCLQELARKGAYGIVQNVFIFGSPVVVKTEEFIRARTVVSGRFVNGYHRNDWILGYLFRLTNGGIRRVAGLAKIEDVPDLENVDLTEEVNGHMDYRTAMPRLLRKMGWLVESDEFTEIEDPDPENHQRRQRELINEIEEARKELEKESQKKKGFGAFFSRNKKKAPKKAEWEVYEGEQAPVGRAAPAVAAAGAVAGTAGSTKTEDTEGNNHGVLFDVDAIRAELAKEHALTVDADADELIMAQLQVRELQSTLPPMKLELSPSAMPSPNAGLVTPPGPAVRRTSRDLSSEINGSSLHPHSSHSRRSSHDLRESGDWERSRTPTGRKASVSSQVPYYSTSPGLGPVNGNRTADAGRDSADDEGEISMTFDTSFHDKDEESRSRPSPLTKQTSLNAAATQSAESRPGLARNAQTVPNITIADPWTDEDDAEFGKEKEMELTFA